MPTDWIDITVAIPAQPVKNECLCTSDTGRVDTFAVCDSFETVAGASLKMDLTVSQSLSYSTR